MFDYQPSPHVARAIELDRQRQEQENCFSSDVRKLALNRMSLERYWKRLRYDLDEMKRLHSGLYTKEIDEEIAWHNRKR